MQPHYIKEWRKFRGLTQAALAKKMGISRPYFTMVELGPEKNGRRYDQDFLEAAAAQLDCTVADLIGHPPGERDGVDALLARLEGAERLRIEAAIRAMLATPEDQGN